MFWQTKIQIVFQIVIISFNSRISLNVLSSNMIKNFSCGRLFKSRKLKINEKSISEQEQSFNDNLSMNYCQSTEEISNKSSEDA